MNDLVLSTSSISAYLRCHYRFFLEHVYRLPGAQNMEAAVGQAVHSGVEAFYKSPVRPENALRAAFEHEVERVPAEAVAAYPGALEDALRMLDVYRREVAPHFTPTLVEAPFTMMVEEVIVSGTIDGADEDVRDLKTTDRVSKFNPANYSLQLTIYSWGYRHLTGHAPRRLLLDVLGRSGKIPYRQFEVEPDDRGALDVIGIARDGILKGDYEPNGALSGQCRYCPYIEVCDHAVR